MEEMKLESILLPGIDPQRPIVIAGPCSCQNQKNKYWKQPRIWHPKALRYSARVFGNRVPNPEDSERRNRRDCVRRG